MLMALILMAVDSHCRILQLFLLQLLRCLSHTALYRRPRIFKAVLCPFRSYTVGSGSGGCSPRLGSSFCLFVGQRALHQTFLRLLLPCFLAVEYALCLPFFPENVRLQLELEPLQ